MQQYWSTVERHKIDYLRNTNPYQARVMYENYIKKYPRDYEAIFLYASVLITLKELDLAYEIIKMTKEKYREDENLKDSHHIKDLLDHSCFVAEARCLSYMNKTEELLDLIEEQPIEEQKKYRQVRSFCLAKLGYIPEHDLQSIDSYKKKQFINYNYDRFREYIRRYTYEYAIKFKDKKDSVFEKGFPMNKVLSEVYKLLDDEKSLYLGQLTDTYVFKYDLCGTCENKPVDFFKVICNHNTHDIISILPSDECDKLPYTDLNYLNDMYNNTTRPSQVDKFYKRFQKK